MSKEKISKSVATKEVDAFIEKLGIRAHKLEKLKDHRADLISMLQYGIIEINDKNIKYALETPLEDGTQFLHIKQKRYTVEEATNIAKAFEGDEVEKALGVFGTLCEPIIPQAYLMNLKSEFTDINAIAAFFLPI